MGYISASLSLVFWEASGNPASHYNCAQHLPVAPNGQWRAQEFLSEGAKRGQRKMLGGHVGVVKNTPSAGVSGHCKHPQRREDQARERDESQRAPVSGPFPESPRHGLEQNKCELRRLAEHAQRHEQGAFPRSPLVGCGGSQA